MYQKDMRTLFGILILVGVVGGTGWWYVAYQQPEYFSAPSHAQQPFVLESPPSEPEARLTAGDSKPDVLEPASIRIPSIGVDARIESVGLDENGHMAVPQRDENVAWYNMGFRPGEEGSAVMAGHYDTKTGAPAVFFRLAEVTAGDEIVVIDKQGRELSFRVKKSQLYDHDAVPMEEVFNTKGNSQLNLITCQGTFDDSAQIYSKRMVVYAERAE